MRKWIATIIALLLSGMATMACAGQLASLSVINQNTGERLTVWRHQGRNYVAGNPGDRYAVEVINKTGARVLSVVSVDGINAISGATAAAGQAGYVLDAWRPLEIKGWRKNMEEVAAFYFTRLPDSYAARTERPDNVGVIGVALFQEYVEPIAMSEAAAARGRQAAGSADAKLGTGHGERVASATRMTDFRRASSQPAEVITIYYDTVSHLATTRRNRLRSLAVSYPIRPETAPPIDAQPFLENTRRDNMSMLFATPCATAIYRFCREGSQS